MGIKKEGVKREKRRRDIKLLTSLSNASPQGLYVWEVARDLGGFADAKWIRATSEWIRVNLGRLVRKGYARAQFVSAVGKKRYILTIAGREHLADLLASEESEKK